MVLVEGDMPLAGWCDERPGRLRVPCAALNEDALGSEVLADGIRAFCVDAAKPEHPMQAE